MSDQSEDKPKIIVDEDWKAQVESEREQLRAHESQGEQGKAATSAGEPEGATAAPQTEDGGDESFPLPPASFATLVSSLATQAIAALGQIPDPVERKPVVRLDIARHVIDTLDVLEQKTKGNLTADEAKMLSNLLHELRMVFVHVQRNPPPAEPPQP